VPPPQRPPKPHEPVPFRIGDDPGLMSLVVGFVGGGILAAGAALDEPVVMVVGGAILAFAVLMWVVGALTD
jgi:hypothetical protein